MNDHLNLLPMSVRRQNRLWLRLRQWSVVWIAVAALSLAGSAAQTARMTAQRYRHAQLHKAVEPLRATQQELDQMQRRLTMLRSRESLLAMLDRMQQPVQLLGIVGRSIGDEVQEVQVYDFVVTPTQVAQPVPVTDAAAAKNAPTTKMVDRVQLKIDALGIDDLAVARFVAGLREAGVFDSVALKSSVHVATLPGECRKFTVECVFQ